ncbi:MAG: hypothetical protein SFT93_00775 [Rickettsiaceae bacterium]|nr:hypothetical protein [Rickettsiaceae bacterium]
MQISAKIKNAFESIKKSLSEQLENYSQGQLNKKFLQAIKQKKLDKAIELMKKGAQFDGREKDINLAVKSLNEAILNHNQNYQNFAETYFSISLKQPQNEQEVLYKNSKLQEYKAFIDRERQTLDKLSKLSQKVNPPNATATHNIVQFTTPDVVIRECRTKYLSPFKINENTINNNPGVLTKYGDNMHKQNPDLFFKMVNSPTAQLSLFIKDKTIIDTSNNAKIALINPKLPKIST